MAKYTDIYIHHMLVFPRLMAGEIKRRQNTMLSLNLEYFEHLTPLWKEAIYAVQGGTNSNRCKYQLNSSMHDFIAHLLLKENMDAQSSYHSCKKLDATSPFHLQALIWMIIFSKYDPKGTQNTNIAICVCASFNSYTCVYGYVC